MPGWHVEWEKGWRSIQRKVYASLAAMLASQLEPEIAATRPLGWKHNEVILLQKAWDRFCKRAGVREDGWTGTVCLRMMRYALFEFDKDLQKKDHWLPILLEEIAKEGLIPTTPHDCRFCHGDPDISSS